MPLLPTFIYQTYSLLNDKAKATFDEVFDDDAEFEWNQIPYYLVFATTGFVVAIVPFFLLILFRLLRLLFRQLYAILIRRRAWQPVPDREVNLTETIVGFLQSCYTDFEAAVGLADDEDLDDYGLDAAVFGRPVALLMDYLTKWPVALFMLALKYGPMLFMYLLDNT